MVQLSTPNRGMGPPWGAFCQITLTTYYNGYKHTEQLWLTLFRLDAPAHEHTAPTSSRRRCMLSSTSCPDIPGVTLPLVPTETAFRGQYARSPPRGTSMQTSSFPRAPADWAGCGSRRHHCWSGWTEMPTHCWLATTGCSPTFRQRHQTVVELSKPVCRWQFCRCWAIDQNLALRDDFKC